MKITQTKEISNFIAKCECNIRTNMMLDDLRDRLECTEANDQTIKRVKNVYKAFDRSIGNLKFDISLLFKNPYYSNIKLSEITSGKLTYSTTILPKNHFYPIGFVGPIDSYLSTHMDFGVLSKDITIPMLKEDSEIWMSITPSEIASMKDSIKAARGNVLTFGLGMGYYQYMVGLKSNVKSITIVEKNNEIIDIFNKYVLPQFKEVADKIKIINGDLFDYWNESFLNEFDYVFVDVWKNPKDGLDIVEKMFNQHKYKGKLDIWIEYSLYYPYRIAMLTYFKSLCFNKPELVESLKSQSLTKDCIERIEKYFNNIDKDIKTVNELKHYLNDNEIFRSILSIRL